MSYSYAFPCAFACGGTLLYTEPRRNPFHVNLLVTIRGAESDDKTVLEGAGQEGFTGGFYKVADMLSQPAGTLREGDFDRYREVVEELGDPAMEAILPYAEYLKRAEYVWDGMTSKGNGIVHNAVFKAVKLTEDEMAATLALPPTRETSAKRLLSFTRHMPHPDSQSDADLGIDRFFNPDERQAARAWLAKTVYRV